MFIAKQTIKGKAYHRVMESYRENGKIKKKVLCNLGPYPTIEDALHAAKQHGNDEKARQLQDLINQRGTKGKDDAKGRGTKTEGEIGDRGTKTEGEIEERGTKESRGTKQKPWSRIRAVVTGKLNLIKGSKPVGAVFTEGPLEPARSGKRRFRPRPIPEEAQRIIGDLSELIESKAGDDVLIEQVKALIQISRSGPRYWLRWIAPEKLDYLLKEARRRIPRVRRGFGRASYDLIPPPPEGKTWGLGYWTELTLGILEAKVKGDAKTIARQTFSHYRKTGRIGLAQASLIFCLLKDRPDQSLGPREFHRMYQAADYKSMVASIKRHGEQDGRSKLTQEQVEEIRRRYGQGGVTYKILGEEFGTSRENIYKVIKGKTWKSAGNR